MTELIVRDPSPLVSPDEYGPVAIRVIKLFLDAGRALSIDEVAPLLSMDITTVQYHFDLLIEHDLIVQTKAGFESSWAERSFPDLYRLTSRGRKCLPKGDTA